MEGCFEKISFRTWEYYKIRGDTANGRLGRGLAKQYCYNYDVDLILTALFCSKIFGVHLFVAQPVFTDLAMLKREIDCLKEIVMTNSDGVIDYIKMLVPTYKKAQ